MGVSPLYSIHQYTEDIYKVIYFKGNRDGVRLRVREEEQHYDSKLNEAFCRAKSMVLQYALCNHWDYFFTGTLDRKKCSRYDLASYQQKLTQFVRDKRKAYGTQVQYLFVPEQHKDGAWHVHGLLSGLPPAALRRFQPPEPEHLIHSSYMNWPDYMDKFGFCSLGPIRCPKATSFYITKYVSKELSQRGGELGKHLYLHSRPLRKAECASHVYFYQQALSALCVHDHDFCKTGMIMDADWQFPYQWDGCEAVNVTPLTGFDSFEPEPDFNPADIDPFYQDEGEQQSIAGWCNW